MRTKRKRSVLTALGWHDQRIFMGIARYARQANWHLETRTIFDVLIPRGWKGDGLVACYGTGRELREFIVEQSAKQPTVLLGANNPGIDVPQVLEGNIAAGQMAAQHFLDRGHTKFAWYAHRSGRSAEERREGYREALRAAGYECVILEAPAARNSEGYADTRKWLIGRLKNMPRPLALFALDDQAAVDVIDACIEAHLRIPEDIAVLGVGNLEIVCECSHVPISSVEFDFEQVGYRAAELLDRLMNGQPPPKEPIVMPPVGIVSRKSTDSLAVENDSLTRAFTFIRENFHRHIQINDIARAASVSRRTLSELFARELRQSPSDFLLEVRIDSAKQLLRNTDDKIDQIATACGLLQNLRRSFRKKVGLSPHDYREMHRAKPWVAQVP
jgi:LacI family transcriptional regulator